SDSQAGLVLADPEMAAQLKDLHRHVVVVDPTDPTSEWATLLASIGSDDAPTVDIDPSAPAAIAYTGGTTGFPKGAVHGQHNLVALGAVNAATGFYSTSRVHGVCLPLTTLNLLVLGPLLAFSLGATCVVVGGADPGPVCD